MRRDLFIVFVRCAIISSPSGPSINDGVLQELSSVSYVKMDDVIDGIVQYDRGTLMAT